MSVSVASSFRGLFHSLLNAENVRHAIGEHFGDVGERCCVDRRCTSRAQQFSSGTRYHLPRDAQFIFQRNRFELHEVQVDRHFGRQAQAELQLIQRCVECETVIDEVTASSKHVLLELIHLNSRDLLSRAILGLALNEAAKVRESSPAR